MNVEEYERMYSLEGTYWWFQGRKHIIFSLLEHCGALGRAGDDAPPTTVDLGCGTGLMLEHLSRRVRPVGLDYSRLALDYCRQRGLDALARAEATQLPLADQSVDLVLALDMLEHIGRDDLVYAEIARCLRPGGRAILSVPAFPFLWSEHDEALHHHRRYTRRSFRRLLAGQSLEIERLTYAIAFTFPAIAVFRLLTRWRRRRAGPQAHLILLPRWANSLLIGILKLEAWLLRRIDLPCGVSLLAVARKRPDAR